MGVRGSDEGASVGGPPHPWLAGRMKTHRRDAAFPKEGEPGLGRQVCYLPTQGTGGNAGTMPITRGNQVAAGTAAHGRTDRTQGPEQGGIVEGPGDRAEIPRKNAGRRRLKALCPCCTANRGLGERSMSFSNVFIYGKVC